MAELISINKEQKFTLHILVLGNKRAAKIHNSIADTFIDYFETILFIRKFRTRKTF